MQRRLGLRLLDLLHQLRVLRHQLSQVCELLQKFGEDEAGVGMIEVQVLVEGLEDAVLDLLHLVDVHETWTIYMQTHQFYLRNYVCKLGMGDMGLKINHDTFIAIRISMTIIQEILSSFREKYYLSYFYPKQGVVSITEHTRDVTTV